ncbi:MAG TPA: TIGR03364 family FAD-dependent oxidoreductase [Burkholderiales bacterium]|nr:TIGR03364 family FAD-dependent oxidoreductase [Burkholderiales bacterium]
MTRSGSFDLAVVGAGIVGLAVALAASRRGWRVLVLDRESRAVGASIRNFGFITVTGQEAGPTWQRALRSRDIWSEICPQAGIAVLQRGLFLLARRPAAAAVLEEFLATDMGRDLERLSIAQAQDRAPALRAETAHAVAYSPHELRVEPRQALPKLAAFLETRYGVEFRWGTAAVEVEPGTVRTANGVVVAPRIAVCPGPDMRTLFPGAFRERNVTLCKLQMLRVAGSNGFSLTAPVMGDLSFTRYLGYARLPAAAALQRILESECGQELRHGIHLIIVRSADGTLVVGDSHHYGSSPDPFAPAEVETLILDEMQRLIRVDQARVVERWIGIYPSAEAPCFIDAPDPGVRVVSVTSGTGMSTGFAIGEEAIASWD